MATAHTGPGYCMGCDFECYLHDLFTSVHCMLPQLLLLGFSASPLHLVLQTDTGLLSLGGTMPWHLASLHIYALLHRLLTVTAFNCSISTVCFTSCGVRSTFSSRLLDSKVHCPTGPLVVISCCCCVAALAGNRFPEMRK